MGALLAETVTKSLLGVTGSALVDIGAVSGPSLVGATGRLVLKTESSAGATEGLRGSIVASVVSASEAVVLAGATVGAILVVSLDLAVDANTLSAVGLTDADTEVVAGSVSKIGEGGNSVSAVLVTVVTSVGVLELLEVGIGATSSSVSLLVDGVVSIVGDTTGVVVVVLLAEVVVVSTVVPGTEVVGPAAISVVTVVLITVRVSTWLVAEGVTTEADGVANITRGVLVTLVANTSSLLTVVLVVVARDGVEGDVDLTRVVAPLVVDGLLGIPMVVGSPLVPCVVNPLVVALTLMAGLSVRVMGVNVTGRADGLLSVTIATITGLMAVVLVVSTIGTWLTLVVIGSLPGGNGGDSKGKGEASEHFKDLEIYIKENFKAFK